MLPLTLYCKSYSTDLRRLVRLAQSVEQFNTENIPFYVSVPEVELPLFKEHLSGLAVQLLADEEILQASPRINQQSVLSLRGGVLQQIIKSEFWRLNLSTSYVCLDSDAFFIRPFGQRVFLATDGFPYTMIDEAHDLLDDAMRHKRDRVIHDFNREADQFQQIFGRVGKRYSFGPFPVVWHRDVWSSLDDNYLKPREISFADAIVQAPIESRWYGEALLTWKSIPLHPSQALFKVYHYAWQFDQDRRRGIRNDQLAQSYCGVIYQSAWERDLDWPNEVGGPGSRLSRRLRRLLGRV
jgi:hypothetical protein